MDVNLGRFFFTKFLVRPGQEAKWPLLIPRKKVEGKGLNVHTCSNAVMLRCVVESFIALFERFLG